MTYGARIAAAALFLSALAWGADDWTYFYPESVTTYGCHIDEVDMHHNAGPTGEIVWVVEAFAKRKDHGDWGLIIGEFSPNQRGFDKAMNTCRKWNIEATKRIQKAQAKR